MSTVNNQAANDLAAYRLAAAAMRQKTAAVPLVNKREIVPLNGKIHAVLNGEPLPRDRPEALFGESAISFPTVKLPREQSPER